jgi:ferrous iron transport protein A
VTGDAQAQLLSALRSGQSATIVGLTGGRGMQRRLISMGLHVGTQIEVLRGTIDSGGPTLVAAGETRLAIGHGMTNRILVRVESGAK